MTPTIYFHIELQLFSNVYKKKVQLKVFQKWSMIWHKDRNESVDWKKICNLEVQWLKHFQVHNAQYYLWLRKDVKTHSNLKLPLFF